MSYTCGIPYRIFFFDLCWEECVNANILCKKYYMSKTYKKWSKDSKVLSSWQLPFIFGPKEFKLDVYTHTHTYIYKRWGKLLSYF